MNLKKFEQYKFYRLYDIDFDTATHIIAILKRYKKKDVRYALLRDIVVTYARPFTVSKGNEISKHTLSVTFVPSPSRKLHAELLEVRNQLFAHTDLNYKKPKVGKWNLGKHTRYPMSFKGYDYNKLDRRVNDIKNLIYEVQQNLQDKIRKIQNDL